MDGLRWSILVLCKGARLRKPLETQFENTVFYVLLSVLALHKRMHNLIPLVFFMDRHAVETGSDLGCFV